MNRTASIAVSGALLVGATLLAGCQAPRETRTRDRYRRGVVFVLPGVEGKSIWNRDIVAGLDDGGVTSAIEVYDWTVGVPVGAVVNLVDLERNRAQAEKLAARIVAQRRRFPGCPIALVGHSGGAGLAVLALEALPAGRQIDIALLLAPALSPEYDLTTALRRSRNGIYSFYSEKDVALLKVVTSVLGSIDRQAGPAAGAVGFRVPAQLDDSGRQLYEERLRQVRWTPRLKEFGADGSHIGWAAREFATRYLAPLVIRAEALRPMPLEATTRPVESGAAGEGTR